MRQWLRRIPRPRLLAALASLLALYAVLGGYALPRYLERALPELAAKELKRSAAIGAASFNPFLFKLELSGFTLAEPGGRPIVRFRRLLVDFELSSVLRWAWTFREIALDGLEVLADIDPEGRFNLAELAESLPKGEGGGDPDAPPPRLLLQHIEITDASITLSDRSGARPRFDTVRPLALELHDISTLPERKGPYSISARLPGGAMLAWRGEMSLRPIVSLGEVSLRGLRPASAWRFFQDELRLEEPAGEVDLEVRYRFGYAKGAAELAVEDLRLAARDLALSLQGAKEPFFSLKHAAVAGGRFDLGKRELLLPSIELRGGTVRAQVEADGTLDLEKIAVSSPAPAPPAGEKFSGEKPTGAPWRVKVEGVRVEDIALQLRDLSRAAPFALGVGALGASLSAQVEAGGAGTQVTLADVAVTLSRVSAGEAQAPEPLANLSAIALEGGALDLRGQRLSAKRLSVDGGTVRLEREPDGRIAVLELARSKTEKPQTAAGGKSWSFALDAFELDKLKIALADLGTTPPLAYDIEPLTLALRNIRNEGSAPIRLEAALRVAQGGMLRLSAEALPAGTRASAKATLERMSLKPLQPLVAARTALALGSGSVSAALQAQYRKVKDRDEVRAGGSASVDDLLFTVAVDNGPFLGWKSLAASGISFHLAPDRLAVADIAVRGLDAKIVVNKDRSVNLAQAFKAPGERASAPAPEPAAKEPAAAFPVAIERVHLDKAAIDFSDLSLVLPFAAKIHDFGGDLLGLGNDPQSRALAKLEGRVDEFGLARVEGSLAPFDPTGFLDLSVIFRNVEMSPLSAYSATFAGRRIAAGRLGLDLGYRIEKGALAGDNKVELQDFTLGERVEAPGALSLPLDLAVALLTDAQGRIALALPVKGNVNEPEFSYGHVVWQAIVTVLTNIVTAPFRALFGGGGEAIESIAFDPGRAALLPPEREKLKRLAEALGRRPQLKLVVEGQHGEADLAALRRREVATAVSVRLERAAEGAEPQPVNARDARTQRALEALFAERIGPVPAPAAGASRDGAFYEALHARLVEAAPVPADAVQKLAAARAAAVAEHLVAGLAVPPERVQRKDGGAAAGERAKLALDVAARK
jgi:hypothetical protein